MIGLKGKKWYHSSQIKKMVIQDKENKNPNVSTHGPSQGKKISEWGQEPTFCQNQQNKRNYFSKKKKKTCYFFADQGERHVLSLPLPPPLRRTCMNSLWSSCIFYLNQTSRDIALWGHLIEWFSFHRQGVGNLIF